MRQESEKQVSLLRTSCSGCLLLKLDLQIFPALSKGWRGLPAMGTLTSLESQFHLMVSETNVIFISKHV